MARIYSRTGEDISGAFPDLAEAITFSGAIDGELLILRERRVQSFNVLQQRLNRKAVTGKLLDEFPAHVRAYDLLAEGAEDLRDLPLVTIDPPGSMDLDQAIHIERTASGFVLSYAIADWRLSPRNIRI